jgi:hypothetical protein
MRTAWVVGALAGVVLFGSPVRACLNDREVKTYEREFRSHYMEQPYDEPFWPGSLSLFLGKNQDHLVLSTLGIGFLAGAVLIGGTRKPRGKAPPP